MSRIRTGMANHMTRHDDDIVRRARVIWARGYWTASEVQQHLADEGVSVSLGTLEGWLQWRSRIQAGGPIRETRAYRPPTRAAGAGNTQPATYHGEMA